MGEFTWRLFLNATFGFATEAYKPTHIQNHHVHTELEEDHLHTAQMKYRWPLLNLLLFGPTVYPAYLKAFRKALANESKLPFNYCNFVCQFLCAYGISITLVVTSWRRGLVCWVLPNIVGAYAMITMNMLQHAGCEPIAPGEHKGQHMEIN